MRIYRMKEMQEVEKIYCNKCGKEIPAANGFARAGVFHAVYEWGYFSEKDGETHTFDLCEACYDALTDSFEIPVEIEG